MDNLAYLHTTRHGSKDLLKNIDTITILGMEGADTTPEAPLYMIEIQRHGKFPRPILVPVDTSARKGMIGAMGNGVFAELSREAQNYITELMNNQARCPEMISVHDRFETQDHYNAMCM